MKIRLLIIALTILSIYNNAFGQKLETFKAMLENCGMSIEIPAGFVECKENAKKNKVMPYDYAIKYTDKNFEVRYAIRPIKLKKYEDESEKAALEGDLVFRNTEYPGIIKAVITQISGIIDYDYQVQNDSVKISYNADWVAISNFQLFSDYAKKYTYCRMIAIHKNDVADGIYFFLSETKEDLDKNAVPVINSLKFNK